MGEPGMYKLPQLQTWQRESILAAAAFLRDRFGDPPIDAEARAVLDALLEVVDPPRRALRIQKEMNETARRVLAGKNEQRTGDRRKTERRKVDVGPPQGTAERRKGERRSGRDRRARR
jgi:hypothetical protein